MRLRDLRAHLADRAAPAVIFSASPPKTCPAGAMAVLRKPDDLARLAHAVKSALVADARRAQLARTERLEREVKETYANVAHPTEAPPPPDSLPESLLPSGSLAAPAVPTGVGSSGTRRVPLRSDSGAPGARAGGRR